jgi:4-amino-4-deoxy-L-arabinose transferase-like glycosyltransferase
MKYLNKYPFLLLTLLCIAIFMVHLDALWVNIMEARNFVTAREMLQKGNWVLTTLNEEPRYQKPPLPTWLSAGSAFLFGIKSVFAMRIPAALVSILMILTTYVFAKKLTNNNTYAFISSLILATSFFIVFSGRNGQWDIFTHGFMMVAIYQLYLLFSSQEKKYKRALIAALFFGCSFMSKGPVSLYTLLLPFLLAYGFVFNYKKGTKSILPLLLFLIVALLLSSWWHVYIYIFDTEKVLATTSKETANWSNYNVRPFYYYWSFFTQSGIWSIPAFIGLLYPYLKNRVFFKKGYQFTLLWTLISVVLLSVIPEKKSRYLLPVLLPLALNTGFYIEYLFRRFANLSDKKEIIPVYINFGIIGLIGVVLPVIGYLFLKDITQVPWIWFAAVSISSFIIGVFIFLQLFQKKIKRVFSATILLIVCLVCFGMPLSKATFQNNAYKSFTALKQWEAENKIPVYEFAYFTPEIIWEYGSSIPVIYNQNQTTTLPDEKTFAVLVGGGDESNLKEAFKNYRIQKVSRYDININSPSHKKYNGRLWRDLFLVSMPKNAALPID